MASARNVVARVERKRRLNQRPPRPRVLTSTRGGVLPRARNEPGLFVASSSCGCEPRGCLLRLAVLELNRGGGLFVTDGAQLPGARVLARDRDSVFRNVVVSLFRAFLFMLLLLLTGLLSRRLAVGATSLYGREPAGEGVGERDVGDGSRLSSSSLSWLPRDCTFGSRRKLGCSQREKY